MTTSMPWATVSDVKNVTGKVVTQDQLSQGCRVLETLTGMIEGVDRPDTTDRDRHWLKLAAAYEAAFVKDNPDLFSREDTTSVAQDSASATFRNVDSHLLAPLARKAIRRLSWRQLIRKGDRAEASKTINNVNSEEFDDSLPWVAL